MTYIQNPSHPRRENCLYSLSGLTGCQGVLAEVAMMNPRISAEQSQTGPLRVWNRSIGLVS